MHVFLWITIIFVVLGFLSIPALAALLAAGEWSREEEKRRG